ncbi:MAG: chromosomal replication initiator protein DnaA [Clostridia bacterium]|nr:chromosomal replication initiator protein DnaA [Clostridia bacterium]
METDVNKIWRQVIEYTEKNTDKNFGKNIHIKAGIPLSCDESFFYLSFPKKINKNIVDCLYKKNIENSLELITGNKLSLKTVVTVDLFNDLIDEADFDVIDFNNIRLGDPIPLGTDIPIGGVSPKYTFDNFIVGSSNAYASAAAKSVSETPGIIYNPLFIYGNSGLGKTHLMQAIGNKTKELHPEMNILYITGEKFTTDFIRSVRENKMQEFTAKYRTPDVLLVDDVQFIESKEATQEEFFHTFNELFTNNKQIVLTSDRKPSDLTTLTDRLRTRFSQGLIIDISIPNYETRVAILQNKAADYNITIPDEILDYIAENVRSNIRELEGVLKSVVSRSQFEEQEITLDFVKATLGKIVVTDNVKITPKKIIEKTSLYYQITENDIMGKIKTKEIAVPRQIAMYLCRRLLSMNDTQIGKEFNKDRSTVSSNINKIEKDIAVNVHLEGDINYIIKDIQSR